MISEYNPHKMEARQFIDAKACKKEISCHLCGLLLNSSQNLGLQILYFLFVETFRIQYDLHRK